MTAHQKQVSATAATVAGILALLFTLGSSAFGTAYAPRDEFKVTQDKVLAHDRQLERMSGQIDDIHKYLLEGKGRR